MDIRDEQVYFRDMGMGEIVLILVVYLLLFGAKGIPSLAQTLGKAVYQFRNAARDVQNEIMSSATDIQRQVNLTNTPQPKRPSAFSRPNPEEATPAQVEPPTAPDESLKPDQQISNS